MTHFTIKPFQTQACADTAPAYRVVVTLLLALVLLSFAAQPAAAQNGAANGAQRAPAAEPVEVTPAPAQPQAVPAEPGQPVQPAPAGQPAQAPAADGPIRLQGRVVAFTGNVQYRATANEPWAPIEVGLKVDEGYEIRTSFRSKVQVNLIPADPSEPEHEIVIDRLGVVKLLQAVEADGKITTDLGMKYGRASYRVETGSTEHVSRIHAPGSTLALRSTDGMLQWDPLFGPYVIVNQSANSTFHHTLRNVTIPLDTGILTETDSGPARHSLRLTVINPVNTWGGTTEQDNEVINRLPGFGDTPGMIGDDLHQIAQQASGSATPPHFEFPHSPMFSDVDAGGLFLAMILYDPSPDGDLVNLYFQDALASEPTLITPSPLQLSSLQNDGDTFEFNLLPGINIFTVENANTGSGDLTNTATGLILTGPQEGEIFDFTTFDTGDRAGIRILGRSEENGESPPVFTEQ